MKYSQLRGLFNIIQGLLAKSFHKIHRRKAAVRKKRNKNRQIVNVGDYKRSSSNSKYTKKIYHAALTKMQVNTPAICYYYHHHSKLTPMQQKPPPEVNG
jgi:hypothetical protein